MAEPSDSPAGRTPEEFLTFLRGADDERLLGAVRALGAPEVISLVLRGMAERFGLRPQRIDGLLVFELDDNGAVYRQGVALTPGGARHEADPDDKAKATVKTSLLRFLRVALGSQDPRRLVVTGRLRLSGDVVWAVTTLASLRS